MWFGKYSVAEYRQVNQQVESQRQQNAKLAQLEETLGAILQASQMTDAERGKAAAEKKDREEARRVQEQQALATVDAASASAGASAGASAEAYLETSEAVPRAE